MMIISYIYRDTIIFVTIGTIIAIPILFHLLTVVAILIFIILMGFLNKKPSEILRQKCPDEFEEK